MESSSPQTPEQLPARLEMPDRISVARWFAIYAVLLLGACVWLGILIHLTRWDFSREFAGIEGRGWRAWLARLEIVYRETPSGIKLLIFAIYLSLCTTFVPLPTGPVSSAVALRQCAVGAGLWDTTLIVALVGSAASVIANLNDYHLFTWMLRNHRVAAVRHTRLHRLAARWFARRPFLILIIFNIIHIPIDVARMLAATDRYGRLRFAESNFIGRFIRYGAIAFVTYKWNLDWMPWALLGLTVVFGLGGVLMHRLQRVRRPQHGN
jgi:membrane protein YqaA with SNARE-associated domain